MLKTWSDRKSHGREWTWDVDGRCMGRSMERVLKRREKARYPSQGEKWLITRRIGKVSRYKRNRNKEKPFLPVSAKSACPAPPRQ